MANNHSFHSGLCFFHAVSTSELYLQAAKVLQEFVKKEISNISDLGRIMAKYYAGSGFIEILNVPEGHREPVHALLCSVLLTSEVKSVHASEQGSEVTSGEFLVNMTFGSNGHLSSPFSLKSPLQFS